MQLFEMRRKLALAPSPQESHGRLCIQKQTALFTLSLLPKLGQKSMEQKLWLCSSFPPTHQPQRLSLKGDMGQTSL